MVAHSRIGSVLQKGGCRESPSPPTTEGRATVPGLKQAADLLSIALVPAAWSWYPGLHGPRPQISVLVIFPVSGMLLWQPAQTETAPWHDYQ